MRSSKVVVTGLFLGPILLSAALAAAADWHVAPHGVNGAAGSEAEPLQTLIHALERAGDGDRILLRREGTYHALQIDLGSGLTLDAYGQGSLPVLTASVEVELPDPWADNSAVRTGAVAEQVVACYVDGRFVPLARYPNQGFLRIDNDDDPDRIVDAELAQRPGVAPGRWTGAQVRWRRWSWWWETRPITGHPSADTLDLGEEGKFHDPFSDAGSGFFIDNDLDELDAPGEWFWGGGTLYLYPPAWADPDGMKVQVVTSPETGLSTSGTTLRNVHLSRFGGTALEINRPATVEDCTFSEIETDAVRFTWNGQPFTIRRSVFRDVRNIAISGWADDSGPAGSLIERNLFLRIGMERGYGGSGAWHAAGVILGNANGAIFRLNRVVDTGYAGIILGSDGQTVERNVFVRTMGTLNDGAAVYTNCNASIIRENIILDTIGDLETSHPWWPLGHGIWPEFLSDFRDTQIISNTMIGSNGFGLMLPNNFTCTVTDNVAVDNRRAGFGLSGDANDSQDHLISGNTLAALSPSRRLVRPENLSHWWLEPYAEPVSVALEYDPALDYGLMTATTFIASVGGTSVIRAEDDGEFDDLAQWTNAASWADASDSTVVRANALVLFNDTEASREVMVPSGDWTLPDGSAVGPSLSIDPFRSVVLVSSAGVVPDPPYLAASGIDWRADSPTGSYLTPSPEMAVYRQGVAIVDDGLDSVGSSRPQDVSLLEYSLANEGGAVLTLGPPVTPEDLSNCAVTVDSQPAAELVPGASSALTVSVTPAAAGPWSFSLSLATNDDDENPFNWTVQGEAYLPPDGAPDGGEDGAMDDGSDGAADGGADGLADQDGDGGVADGADDDPGKIEGQGCTCGSGATSSSLMVLLFMMFWPLRRRLF